MEKLSARPYQTRACHRTFFVPTIALKTKRSVTSPSHSAPHEGEREWDAGGSATRQGTPTNQAYTQRAKAHRK